MGSQVVSVWPQLIFWLVLALGGPILVQKHHLNFLRHKQSNWLCRWRVRRCVSTFFCGEKLNTRLKDAFSPYKFWFWKLGGFYAWTKIGPLDSGPIFPSLLKPIELGKFVRSPTDCRNVEKKLKSVAERVNFWEIDPKYLYFSQFFASNVLDTLLLNHGKWRMSLWHI